jgi:hypothetical protein
MWILASQSTTCWTCSLTQGVLQDGASWVSSAGLAAATAAAALAAAAWLQIITHMSLQRLMVWSIGALLGC